jgi:hypothetical protein
MLSDDAAAQITEYLIAGDKIKAIKLYREQTGEGLAEAKAFVEQMEAELRRTAPEKFSAVKAGGCLGVLLLCFVGMAIVTGGVLHAFAC